MAVNSHTTGHVPHHADTTSHALGLRLKDFGASLARFGGKAKAKAKSGLRAAQMARMLSTLSKMSDAQLAMMGIQRSDIPQYAKTLMAEE